MKVLDPKEGMKIKQQMVPRNLESLSWECLDSPRSTVHQMGVQARHSAWEMHPARLSPTGAALAGGGVEKNTCLSLLSP